MKKLLAIAMAVLMLVSCMTFVASAQEVAPVTVTLNGNVVDCAAYGQPATIVEGRTLVPLRAIFEALGASVEWDQPTKTVTSQMGDITIALTIGADSFTKNGEEVALDVPGMIMNGRTLVPARAIAEAYGVDVQWDAATRTVILTKAEEKPLTVPRDALFSLTAEEFKGTEGYLFTSGTGIEPQIVSNPFDESDKVVFLDSPTIDKPAWTYFRNNNVKYVPGARYIANFDILLEKNALDIEIGNAKVAVCVRYADSSEDGTVKDHGINACDINSNEWVNASFIFTVPETLDASQQNGFGIYCNPIQDIALSYYLDNIYVAPYYGALEDCILSGFESKTESDNVIANNASGEDKPVQVTPPAVKDESLVFAADAESFKGTEGYLFTSSVAIEPQVVANPADESDLVFFLDSPIVDKEAWTYFRNNNIKYKAGERYIVSFDLCLEKNSLDVDIDSATFGVCAKYADSVNDEVSKDHGVATIKAVPNEWINVTVIYTIPETASLSQVCGFGIFANPVNGLPVSYYFDNVKLSVYSGNSEDGAYFDFDAEAELAKQNFDINNASGDVFDLDTDDGSFVVTASTPEYKNGHLVMTCVGEGQVDPIINFANSGKYNADNYGAIAVRFKAEGVPAGSDHIAVYFATVADDKLSQSKCVSIKYNNISVDSEGYYVAYIDMTVNEFWNGQLAALRIDPGNGNGIYTIDKIVVVSK